MKSAAPPALASRLLARLLPAHLREPFLGDLEEAFEELTEARGRRAAAWWYWREALIGLLTQTHRSRRAPNERRGDGPVTTALADFQFAVRMFRRHPGFTALVVFVLALGIGATTAIFSAVYPILLAPLPYPEANRLVTFQERGKDGSPAGIGFATLQDVADMNHSFQSVAAITSWDPALTGNASPELLAGEHVSYTYFSTLGVRPFLGRDFVREEDRPGAPRVAMLTNALWRSRFGGDSSIVGRPITLDGIAFTVVGVLPSGFENVLSPNVEIFTPLRYTVTLPWACRTCHHVRAVARMKPAVSVAGALADLDAISARLVAEHPSEYGGPGMLVTRVQDQVTHGVRPALLAVLGAVMLLLLISCANVANLLLARAAARRAEFSMRAAFGAGRWRVIRQLIAESFVLTGAGGVLGVLMAVLGVRLLVAIAPERLPRAQLIGVSGPVLAVTVLVVTAIAMICGVIPAWHAMRADVHSGIKRSGRRAIGGRQMLSATLVVSEIALASMLLVGSGLLVRTMMRLFAVSPGFDETNVLTMQVQTTGRAFSDSAYTLRYFDRVLANVRALPGVQAAALTSQLPLSGDYDAYGVHLESRPSANPEQDPSLFRYAVSPGYVEAMRIPLRRGRLFTAQDSGDRPAVALINESFARKVWPNGDPIGQRVRVGAADTGAWRTIVGIVGDVKQLSLSAEPSDAIYVPEAQWSYTDGAMSLVVRTAGDAAALTPAVRLAIWSVDKDQPIVRVATLESLAAETEAQRHFTLLLFTTFAAAALVLAAAGVYGVLSGSVAERMPELGVRAALGASARDLLAMIVARGLGLAALGLGLGLAGALALSRLMAALLFGVGRADGVTYGSVATLLLFVAAAASALPAWRAARVDPAEVLRAE